MITPLYIFDLDGTLALTEHRNHFIEAPSDWPVGKPFKKDWQGFYAACVDDKPNWPVLEILAALYTTGSEFLIWTGRGAEVRAQTVNWLSRNLFDFGVHVSDIESRLRMRPIGDHTEDAKLKTKWLSEMASLDRCSLAGVFEDRRRVVDAWREAGIPCFQVAPGNF